jgi:hypothetical protein
MTYDEAMTSLEKAGTAQNRKVYANHGVRGEQFGVSWAHFSKMLKQVKRDHELAKKAVEERQLRRPHLRDDDRRSGSAR